MERDSTYILRSECLLSLFLSFEDSHGIDLEPGDVAVLEYAEKRWKAIGSEKRRLLRRLYVVRHEWLTRKWLEELVDQVGG